MKMTKQEEIVQKSREHGLLGCGWFGNYGGKRCFFTHRKPGFFYTEDVLDAVDAGFNMPYVRTGKWIPSDKIVFE